MRWSKIQNTELATEAFCRIVDNEIAGCCYHSSNHIQEMYDYLESTQEPYDEALDWAVMFHDVVYDNKPEKEERSALLFLEMSAKIHGCTLSDLDKKKAYILILNTRDHVVCDLEGSSAIIRADLHALTDKVSTVNNYTKIMNETIKLYDCSIEDFAKANIDFMDDLYYRIIGNKNLDPQHEKFYDNVCQGILLTRDLSIAIL